jgi:hypothetical protein
MFNKKVALLLATALVLVPVAVSCASENVESSLLANSTAVTTTTTEASGPRFVITATPSPAFEATTIVPRTIEPTGISPVRDLRGTWRGTGVSFWIDGATGTRVAKTTWDVTLAIDHQQGDAVQGTLTLTTIKQENLGAANLPVENYGPDALENGIITGTTLDFNVDVWRWTFTFSTDLMSGQFTTPDPGIPCDPKAFTVTRQK